MMRKQRGYITPFLGTRATDIPLPWLFSEVVKYWDGSQGITITGSGVSSWAPIVGSGTFTQGTDAARPTYASNTLTFDGTAQYMATGAFTQAQPLEVIMCVKQISWTAQDIFFDGIGADPNRCVVEQRAAGASPQLEMYAGTALGGNEGNLAVGSFGILRASFNAGSSGMQVNLNSVTAAGNVGSGGLGGLTIGSSAATFGPVLFSNIAIKGIALLNSQFATQARANLFMQSMMSLYGVA